MNIIIFGATGPTGQQLLRQALEDGHSVTAFARNVAAITTQHERLRVVQGDALDAAAVDKAMSGHDTVISLLGTPFTFKPVKLFSEGTRNIIQAMHKRGMRRLLCISSGGTNPSADSQHGFFFNTFVKPTIRRSVYLDMRRMEQLVKRSGLDWTIVRPLQLYDGPLSKKYHTEPGYIPSGKTSRADLVDFLLKQMRSTQYRQQAVAMTSYDD
jgi:putative NADH-flavin reductase